MPPIGRGRGAPAPAHGVRGGRGGHPPAAPAHAGRGRGGHPPAAPAHAGRGRGGHPPAVPAHGVRGGRGGHHPAAPARGGRGGMPHALGAPVAPAPAVGGMPAGLGAVVRNAPTNTFGGNVDVPNECVVPFWNNSTRWDGDIAALLAKVWPHHPHICCVLGHANFRMPPLYAIFAMGMRIRMDSPSILAAMRIFLGRRKAEDWPTDWKANWRAARLTEPAKVDVEERHAHKLGSLLGFACQQVPTSTIRGKPLYSDYRLQSIVAECISHYNS